MESWEERRNWLWESYKSCGCKFLAAPSSSVLQSFPGHLCCTDKYKWAAHLVAAGEIYVCASGALISTLHRFPLRCNTLMSPLCPAWMYYNSCPMISILIFNGPFCSPALICLQRCICHWARCTSAESGAPNVCYIWYFLHICSSFFILDPHA